MGYRWLVKEDTGAISSRVASWVWTGGEHSSLPFWVGVTRKVFFLPAGSESLTVSTGGTRRSPRQARTSMWPAEELPWRDEGCC